MRSELGVWRSERAPAGRHETRTVRRRRRALTGLFAALAVALGPAVSRAGAPGSVVMVVDDDLAAFGARLRAELGSMGFEVELAMAGGSEPSARVTVALTPTRPGTLPEGVVLRVVDGSTGSTLLGAVLETSPPDAASTLALRAAELIRGTLVELAAAGPAPPTSAPSEREAEAVRPLPVAPVPPADSLAASPAEGAAPRVATLLIRAGVVASPGGLAPFPALELGAALWMTRGFGAELGVLVPLASMSHDEQEGSSESQAAALSLALRGAIEGDAWGIDLGAGAALIRFDTHGSASGPAYTSEERVFYGIAPLGRAGVRYALSTRWRAGAQVWAGRSLPRFVIDYGGRSVANWGAPIVFGSLGLEVDVP